MKGIPTTSPVETADVSEKTSRGATIAHVLFVVLLANMLVVITKFTIGAASGSLAVLGDAVHSSADAANNLVALLLMRVARQAPDENHPYGHQKFETVGALAIVAFLSISCFELVQGAVRSLLMASGEPPSASPTQIYLLVGTLLVNIAVATYETRAARRTGSDLLLADAAHTKSDVLITTGVILSLFAGRTGSHLVDPVAALIITAVIAILAYRILARAIPILVDEHVVPAERIRRLAEQVDGVDRAYHIRSRSAPEQRFAELTIAVNADASVRAAHVIADQVEHRLSVELDFNQVVVHVEPC